MRNSFANAVGYQGKGLKNGDYTWSIGTFANIAKTHDNMTLADVKLIRTKGDMSCGKVLLYLMGANGANFKITDEENPFKGQSASFMYLDEVEAEETREEPGYEHVTAGWYHAKDEDFEYPMDNYPLPYGLGYSVMAMADDYVVQWAGQVENDANMPVISLNKNDYTWTGNAAPTNLKLKDFVLTRTKGDMSCGKVLLYLMGANGANLKITDEESPFKGQSASFMYLDEVEAEETREEPGYEHVTAGWYHAKDEDFEYPMNEWKVDAALGFSVMAMADDYQFQLAGAIK